MIRFHRIYGLALAWLVGLLAVLWPAYCWAKEEGIIVLHSLGVQVRLPAGWGVSTSLGEQGMTLRGPEGRRFLDVVVWEPMAERLSAAAAARAHERVLSTRYAFTKVSEAAFVAADGSPAMLVAGVIQDDSGVVESVLYAAYVFRGRYYVVGTSCPPDEVQQVSRGFFDDAIRTFSPTGTRLEPVEPTSEPGRALEAPMGALAPLPTAVGFSGAPTAAPSEVTEVAVAAPPAVELVVARERSGELEGPLVPETSQPVVPESVTELTAFGNGKGTPFSASTPEAGGVEATAGVAAPPAFSGVSAPLAVRPAVEGELAGSGALSVQAGPGADAPQRRPASGAELATHRDPTGFTVTVPAGWTVQILGGCVQIWAPENRRQRGVAVWPLVRGKSAPLTDRAVQAAHAFAALLGSDWRQRQIRLVAGADVAAVCSGEVTLDGGRVRVVAALVPGEGVDVLEAVLFAPETVVADRLVLASILASLEWEARWFVVPRDLAGGIWTDATGALAVMVEEGWAVEGAVRQYNGFPVIAITGSHPLSGARFSWQQPHIPFVRERTPDLEIAGWVDGAEFPPDHGLDPLLIGPRPVPTDVCSSLLALSGATEVKVCGPSSPAAGLLPGGQGAYAEAEGPEWSGGAVCAVTRAPRRIGRDTWIVASLTYGGPPGTAQAAGAALRRLVTSAQALADAMRSEGAENSLCTLVEGAAKAAAALPDQGPDLGPRIAVMPALGGLVPEGSPGAVTIGLPSRLTWVWQLAGPEPEARLRLPELFVEASAVGPQAEGD